MAKLKLTKQSLRGEQTKLKQLKEYLPTLQLKKMMLQFEINQAKAEIQKILEEHQAVKENVMSFSALLTAPDFEVTDYLKIQHIQKHYENIAGLELPLFEGVIFAQESYSLFDTPVWIDTAIAELKKFIILREKSNVFEEKKRALERELHEVSIRVNLFEKILIPKTHENMRKIKIFLSDLELAAVCQAKVAKRKIQKSHI